RWDNVIAIAPSTEGTMASMLWRRMCPSIVLMITISAPFAVRVAAQCTARSDATDLGRSLNLSVRCNDRVLRFGPGVTCRQSLPPGCAGSVVTDTVALAYGSNNPASVAVDRRALRDQLSCQKQI